MTASDTVGQGFSLAYSYDVNHRLTQIKSPSLLVGEGRGEGASSTFTFTYDSSGRRTKLTYPNEVTTNYTYDSSNRLTNLLTQGIKPAKSLRGKAEAILIDSFTYTHDKVGNRLTKVETSPLEGEGRVRGNDGIQYSYSYDTIYRLLQSMPAKIKHNGTEKEFEHRAENFAYDPVGNRLTGPKEKLSYTYNTSNQLTELTKQDTSPLVGEGQGEGDKNKTQFTYDKNGNLTKKIEYDDDGNIKTITLYTYDFENRLIRVEMQKDGREKIIEFTYDPFGRRLSKSIHREEIEDDEDNDKDDEDKKHPRATYYVYDNEDIIMEYNHKGKVTARYIHGLGIDEPLAVQKKKGIYYYHADGLGSVTALTDSKGKVVQRYDYDSFGNLKHHGHKVKQPYTYTGREYDRETGLYYYRARYYDAKVGRFISVDPILRGMSHTDTASCKQSIKKFPLDKPIKLHPFVYTDNNPINYVDPKGLACGPGIVGDIVFPDNWFGWYNFKSACGEHDNCYATCGSSKTKCDDDFLRNMLEECSTLTPNSYWRNHCEGMAYFYYRGVISIFGKWAYDDAQKKACCK